MSLARVRKGDTVVVISGKDKGKTGKVLSISPEHERVLIEGINLVKRHTKASARNREGGIVESERAIHLSKVMPLDPETGKGTRVKVGQEGGEKVRIAKSGKVIRHEVA